MSPALAFYDFSQCGYLFLRVLVRISRIAHQAVRIDNFIVSTIHCNSVCCCFRFYMFNHTFPPLCRFQYCFLHLSEQKTFLFLPAICLSLFPQFRQISPSCTDTSLFIATTGPTPTSPFRLQYDFTVLSGRISVLAICLYPLPSSRILRILIFCSSVINCSPLSVKFNKQQPNN